MSEVKCNAPLLCNCPNCYAVIIIRRSLELERLQRARESRRTTLAVWSLFAIVFALTYIALLIIDG